MVDQFVAMISVLLTLIRDGNAVSFEIYGNVHLVLQIEVSGFLVFIICAHSYLVRGAPPYSLRGSNRLEYINVSVQVNLLRSNG